MVNKKTYISLRLSLVNTAICGSTASTTLAKSDACLIVGINYNCLHSAMCLSIDKAINTTLTLKYDIIVSEVV